MSVKINISMELSTYKALKPHAQKLIEAIEQVESGKSVLSKEKKEEPKEEPKKSKKAKAAKEEPKKEKKAKEELKKEKKGKKGKGKGKETAAAFFKKIVDLVKKDPATNREAVTELNEEYGVQSAQDVEPEKYDEYWEALIALIDEKNAPEEDEDEEDEDEEDEDEEDEDEDF